MQPVKTVAKTNHNEDESEYNSSTRFDHHFIFIDFQVLNFDFIALIHVGGFIILKKVFL